MRRINQIIRYAWVICAIALLTQCDKSDPGGEGKDDPLVFTGLTAARDTIFTEDTTRLSAAASGYNITYSWWVEKGDLIGSGPEIIFVATPCTVGNNPITCTVTDGNQQSKSLVVTVTVL